MLYPKVINKGGRGKKNLPVTGKLRQQVIAHSATLADDVLNEQQELHPLEYGRTALNLKKYKIKFKDYAAQIGKPVSALQWYVNAARVLEKSTRVDFSEWKETWRNLAEIHVAPEWLWALLAERAKDWTVKQTINEVKPYKDLVLLPWLDSSSFGEALISSKLTVDEYSQFNSVIENALRQVEIDDAENLLLQKLKEEFTVITLSNLYKVCHDFVVTAKNNVVTWDQLRKACVRLDHDFAEMKVDMLLIQDLMRRWPKKKPISVKGFFVQDYTSLISGLIAFQTLFGCGEPYELEKNKPGVEKEIALLQHFKTTEE